MPRWRPVVAAWASIAGGVVTLADGTVIQTTATTDGLEDGAALVLRLDETAHLVIPADLVEAV